MKFAEGKAQGAEGREPRAEGSAMYLGASRLTSYTLGFTLCVLRFTFYALRHALGATVVSSRFFDGVQLILFVVSAFDDHAGRIGGLFQVALPIVFGNDGLLGERTDFLTFLDDPAKFIIFISGGYFGNAVTIGIHFGFGEPTLGKVACNVTDIINIFCFPHAAGGRPGRE